MQVSTTCFLAFCALVLLQTRGHAAKLRIGDITSPCRADDPELNECARRAMIKAVPKMAKGVRELGLIPFDPMQVPQVVIDQSGSGAVGLKLTFINSKHEGVSQLQPTAMRVVPEKMFFEVNSTLPSYRMTGGYEVSGRILLLPVSGKGPSNLTMNNLDLNWKFYGKPEKRNNKVYCRLVDSRIGLKIRSGTFRLENLFNGDKLLGDNMNRILNENFVDVINELLPALEATFGELYLRLITPIFASVPFEEIFPGIDLKKVQEGSFNV